MDSAEINIIGKTKESLYWNVGSTIPVQIITFIVSIIVARILDPKDFGIMAIGIMVISYANSITNFGFSNVLVQRDNINNAQINSIFTLDISLSIMFSSLTIFGSSYIAQYFKSPESADVLRILSCIFLLTSFTEIPKSLLMRAVNYKLLSFIVAFESVSRSLITLLFVILGFKYWSLVWGHIIPMVLSCILLLYKVDWIPKINYNHQAMKGIYSFSVWHFIRSQLFVLNQNIMTFIIGRSMGPLYLGYFGKAFSLSQLSKNIGMPIDTVMFSTFSRLQKDRIEVTKWFQKLLTIQTILILPLLVGLFILAPHFIIVLLGKNWNMSIIPLQILCLANIFRIYNGGIASFNVGMGAYKEQAIRVAFCTLLLFILCLYFINWGLKGACYSYLLVSFIWFVLVMNQALKNLSVSFKKLLMGVFPYLGANVFMLAVMKTFTSSVCSEMTLANLVSLVLVGSISYCVCIVLTNLIRGNNMLYPFR